MSNKCRVYTLDRAAGYNVNLYRDVKHKRIAGVCAGLAEHFEIDRSFMRIFAVAALIFTGPLTFWSYMILWLALAPQKEGQSKVTMEYDEDQHRYRKAKVFRYGEQPSQRVAKAKERLAEATMRVEDMEAYITSSQFELKQAFSKLNKEPNES